jgi:hypothetical protein
MHLSLRIQNSVSHCWVQEIHKALNRVIHRATNLTTINKVL